MPRFFDVEGRGGSAGSSEAAGFSAPSAGAGLATAGGASGNAPAAALHGAEQPAGAALAYLSEVFLSFQGEGVHAGARQVFVRLAGCDIRCPWCDTPDALLAKTCPEARIETRPNGPWLRLSNPVSPAVIVSEVERIAEEHGPVRWVALTGGEPTIWRRFLVELCPLLQAAGFVIYLETNSHHPDTLRALGDTIAFVSADLKLPWGDYAVGRDVYGDFLEAIPREGQVKIVVTADVSDAEVEEAAALVAAVRPDLPLVLQPVSAVPGFAALASPEQLLRQQRLALTHLADVRIIPQLHKALGVR